jgi:protein tyrosine phosphatase (PTP) superfamily phosphohydrolase (DUF442 family)
MTASSLSRIYHYLPLSRNLLTSGQPTREQFAILAEAGVKTVVNLALPTSPNALPDEEAIVTALGMEYFHIPVIWETPDSLSLEKFMNLMEKLGSRKTLVHCAANMRVSAFIALYRILRLGWEHERAFKDVYRIWDPYQNDDWRPFINEKLNTRGG